MNFDADRYTALHIHWEAFLREVIGGKQLASISRLGSAGTLVRARIGSSGTKEEDESAVRAALDSVLLEPPIASTRREERPRAILCIIELVGELKPERGAEALASILQADDRLLSPAQYSHAGHLRTRDLRKQALIALGDYYAVPIFSAPDSHRTAAYCTYLDILTRHLTYPDCTVEAALQFLRVNQIQMDDEWPLKLDPSTIKKLVPRAIDLMLFSALEVMQSILLMGGASTYAAFVDASHASCVDALGLYGSPKTLWT